MGSRPKLWEAWRLGRIGLGRLYAAAAVRTIVSQGRRKRVAGVGVQKYAADENQRHKQQRRKEFEVVIAIKFVLVRHDCDSWCVCRCVCAGLEKPTGTANPKFRKDSARRLSCAPRRGPSVLRREANASRSLILNLLSYRRGSHP